MGDLVEIDTPGSENWMNGLSWRRVIAALKRHVAAFEKGEDYDPETGLPHMAHAMCCAVFLCQFMLTHRAWDDRPDWTTERVKP